MRYLLTSTALSGCNVTVAAQQPQSRVALASVVNWGDVSDLGNAQVSINMTLAPGQIAPMGAFFEAEVTGFPVSAPSSSGAGYDPTKTEIFYSWDVEKFNAAGNLIAYTHIYDAPKKLFPAHRDASKLFGANVAHVFEEPGNYRVTVTALHPESAGYATRSSEIFSVLDPDVEYAGNKTVYVHPSADYTNAPAEALLANSFSQALERAKGSPNPMRIMLADGEVFTATGASILPDHPSLIITRSGDGTKRPKFGLDYTTGNDTIMMRDRGHALNGPKSMTHHEIDFFGYWDPVTETLTGGDGRHAEILFTSAGAASPDVTLGNAQEISADFFLAHKCGAKGLKISWQPVHKSALISECAISDWQDYGIFAEDRGRFGLIGNSIKQNLYARSGGPKPSGGVRTNNNHGPVRMATCVKFVADGNEMFSRNGWSGAGSLNGNLLRAEQPCIRTNTSTDTQSNSGVSTVGNIQNIQRNRFEGGVSVVSISVQNTSTTPNVQSVLFDRNEVIGSYATVSLVTTTQGGLTARNNHLTHVNVPRLNGSTNPLAFFRLGGGDDAPVAKAQECNLHHNTLVNLCAFENFSTEFGSQDGLVGEIFADAEFTSITSESNIIHQPVALTPQTSFAPFTTIARPDGENLGYVVEPDNPNAVLPTAQATPSASLAFYLPSGGSSALGEGDPETNQSLSKYVLRDFSGELRPMNASVGAFEN